MSTRWYPLYQRGAPQLRVFLPNFWMKLVKPEVDQPPNVVQFSCSMQMTRYDIRNYLEKIYNVRVSDVRTRIAMGKTKRQPTKGYIVKEDDIKYAYVTLPRDEVFEFPNLFPEEKTKEIKDEHAKTIAEVKKGHQEFITKNKERPHMPGWFNF